MLQSLREDTEGKLQMRLSPWKIGLDSLFKEVRVFKGKENHEPNFLQPKMARLGPLFDPTPPDPKKVMWPPFLHSSPGNDTGLNLYPPLKRPF